MEENKEGKDEGKEQEEDEGGVLALGKVKPTEELAKMSVSEAVKEYGILPINPIEVGDEESVVRLADEAGAIYASIIYPIFKAFARDDLPIDKRVALGMKGIFPGLQMGFRALDVIKRYEAIDNSILSGEDLKTAVEHAKEGGATARQREYHPSKMDVILDIQQRLRTLEEENVALKKEKEERNKKT